MAAAVGAATIWRMRSGRGQDLRLDLRKAIHGINPEREHDLARAIRAIARAGRTLSSIEKT
jgi:hypothetical protein